MSAYRLAMTLALVTALVAGSLAFGIALEHRQVTDRLASFEFAEARVSVTLRTWLRTATAGWLGGNGITRAEVEAMELVAARLERQLHQANLVLAAAVAVAVATPALLRRGTRATVQQLVLVSTGLLALGLFAPLLTLSVHATVPVLGRVSLERTTRGLFEAGWTVLVDERNLVGIIVLLFCMVVPLLKLGLLQALLLRARLTGRLASWLSDIGRFSMLDVLVAAVTVSIFAYGASPNTDARAGVGLYYFAGYCVTSLLASVLLERQQRYEARARRPGAAWP